MKSLRTKIFLIILTLALVFGLAACKIPENLIELKFIVDGELYSTVKTSGSDVVDMPSDPKKDGYVFDGWFWDDGKWEEPFTANSLLNAPISENMNLYAKWKEEPSPESHTHTESDWITDKEATCKEAGSKHIECTECKEVIKTETIAKTDEHTPVTDERVEPTYETEGLTEGSHCSVCDTVIVAQESIPKLTVETLSSKTLTVDELNITGSVGGAVSSFDIGADITAPTGSIWTVSSDKSGQNVIATKKLPLALGDNVYYLHLFYADGTVDKYTVTIYRKSVFTVTYYLYNSPVATQTVEEGALATRPSLPQYEQGYTINWSHDFSSPITEHTHVTGTTVPRDDIPYKVEYYLFDGDRNEFVLEESVTLTGTTNSTAIAEIKTYEGYTCTVYMSNISGTVAADGSLVLKVYYLSGSVPEYTYNMSGIIGTNWNPHTFSTSADEFVIDYLTAPLVSIQPLDTEEGIYQWAYEMATSITDVTKDHQADLTKYKVTLPAGRTAADINSGYVFEIKLNPNAKWETGEKITADDYIESMKDLLDSKMRNYKANLYYASESAVAGGLEYYNSEAPIYAVVVPAYGNGDTPDYSYDIVANKVYIDLNTTGMTFAGYSFAEIKNDYGFIRDVKNDAGEVTVPGATYYNELAAEANPYGMIQVTNENKEKVLTIMDQYCSAFGVSIYNKDGTVNEEFYKELLFYYSGVSEKNDYDETVGLYKVDDYTIRYVCQTAIDINYFLTNCTDNWLVHQETYDKLKKEENGLTVTTYGTSLDTIVSYGAYKMESYTAASQVVFVQNENWYGYTIQDGQLVSYTDFLVDGERQRQYQTTRIVIDAMDEPTAKYKFFRGELMEYSPTAEELSSYNDSDRLYKVDQTYTMSFFFNTDIAVLQRLDVEGGNTNSVVLSNYYFRKAMSLAIDRTDYVTVTQGWKPAFSLMNHLYHYDIYNDPASSYRKSEAAMQAIVNLYGIEYGPDEAYATLKEAYDSITGYNLTEAKALMRLAHDELVQAGLYVSGQDIRIRIGWAKGALTSDDNDQLTKLNQYINAALEGSGFGTVTFEAVGNINDRYGDVPAGKFAIGYGAWSGLAFYPFRSLQVYTDPYQYAINEAGCWNPATEELTLTVEGEEVTMTWQDWGNSMIGIGKYASASNEIKLEITAKLEEEFLKKYYRIPLAVTTDCTLLSGKADYYTDDYNIMYGFGDFRLMRYNYTDAEWSVYVAEQGGRLDYH